MSLSGEYLDIYGDVYLASPSLAVAGSAGYATPVTSSSTPAGARSVQCPVTMTPGDWLFAIVCWRQQEAGQNITFSVADDGHNWWDPIGIPSGTSSASGTIRIAVWRSPAASFCQNVMAAPDGVPQSCTVIVLDVGGMEPFVTDTGVTTHFSNTGTTLTTLSAGAPASEAFMITAFGYGLNSDSASLSGTGWGALASESISNGTDTTSDLTLEVGVQFTPSSTSATWSVSPTGTSKAGILCGVLTQGAAPSQPDANWPATIFETAPGAGLQTPPDSLTWVNTTPRFLDLTVTQGRQYQLSQLQGAQGTVTLDNPDGAVTPPGSGSWAGIASGVPCRLRQFWAGGAWQLQFEGDGSTATPSATTGIIYSVKPSTAYSTSAWLAPFLLYSPGMTIAINWYTSGNVLISSTTSPSVTGPEPVLATASGTSPSNAAKASITITASGTPSTSYVFQAAAAVPAPTWALVIPRAITWTPQNNATISSSSTWAPDRRGPPVISPWGVPFSGYIQTFPQQWDSGTLRGLTQATITDSFGYLTANLQPILQQEILNDSPYAYWPLTDSPPITQASNLAPGNTNPLVLAPSKTGTTGATTAFGANSSALLGAQGTVLLQSSVRSQSQAGMFQQTLPNVSSATNGSCLQCTDTSYPSVANGITVECWFQILAPQQNLNVSVLSLYNPTAFISVVINQDTGTPPSTGLMYLNIGNTNGTGFTQAEIGNGHVYAAPATSLTHVAITMTRSSFTAYVNGQKTASGSISPQATATFTTASFCGITQPNFTSSFTGGYYSGYVAHAAIFPQVLSQYRVNTHYQAGITGMAGDSAVTRIERLLEATPFLGRRCILQEATSGTEQTKVASCQDIGGQAASISLNNISVNTVPGQLWPVPCGDLFYQAKSYAWNNSVSWVLGNRPDLGEIPAGPVMFSEDPQRVLNSIEITQLDNLDIITPQGSIMLDTEIASSAQYGTLSYWVTGYLQGDLTEPLTFGPGLLDLANYIAATDANPVLRITGVTTQAAALPLAWNFWMNAAASDIVTVNWRPPTNAGQLVTVTGRISQVQRDIRFGSSGITGSITCLVDPAPEIFTLTVNDPVRGQLNGTNILGW